MDLFQRFLNQVGQGYGQVDKNIFGGLLPGGAATPIGAAFQRSSVPKTQQPSGFERRKASLIDAAATSLSKAQPFVEKTIKAVPEPVQNVIASGLNTLPFSANLFSRYYTGLGDRNLQIPESATHGIRQFLDKSAAHTKQRIKTSQANVETLSSMLDAVRNKKFPLQYANASGPFGGYVPLAEEINDALAEEKSKLNRIKKGDIPFYGYSSANNNPLTSPATSFGSLWFTPNKDGYTANEKYDFVYGAADAKVPMGPFPMGEVFLNPSQEAALKAANGIQLPNTNRQMTSPTGHPLTFFGRSIVMKMPDKSFIYPINIR